MIHYILNMLKGALMGAANVIPGVSGGTMALLTGVFERLINTIKAFDLTALRLLATGQFKQLFRHIDLTFLSAIGIGVGASILIFARLLEHLFENHPTEIWAFFFGLILASVYFVAKKIQKRTAAVILFFTTGTAIAAVLAFTEAASENDSFLYLMVCGAVAVCSMILPGLSGSYILLLMGNYKLVMIDAVNAFDLTTLIPVALGATGGILIFSRALSWIIKTFHDQTLALLTGFIFGSLSILWPWKEAVEKTMGDRIKVVGYDYFLPHAEKTTFITVAIMATGIITIALIETMASKLKTN